MKAIINSEYGPPEVLQVKEVTKPIPKENEVLVKIYAATVNRTDCGFLRAKPLIIRLFSGLLKPKNKTLGTEFAGKIESIGKNVTTFNPGDKVFGYDEIKFGAHAEYKTMAEADAIANMPINTTYNQAAPILEGAHYALCDIRAAKIKDGQKVLVNGATGAIGSAAVQLLKYFGADVTAVCDTKNVKLVKSLGASEVIDYTKEDFTKISKKFDFVFDAVGKSSFKNCKPLLKKRGIYISTELGYMAQNPFLALITHLLGGKKVMFPIPSISKKDVVFFKGLVESEIYKPVIDKTFKIDQIVEAYNYVETGQKIGNVIIEIGHND